MNIRALPLFYIWEVVQKSYTTNERSKKRIKKKEKEEEKE
jgi:hypothetical protein